jgi:hypothetical protein
MYSFYCRFFFSICKLKDESFQKFQLLINPVFIALLGFIRLTESKILGDELWLSIRDELAPSPEIVRMISNHCKIAII